MAAVDSGEGKPRGPLQHSIASAPVKLLAKPEIKMKCVCTSCNNGWMHDLEQKSIPVLGALLQDISTPLDSQQQTILALWSVKTAMVVEAVKNSEDRHFTHTERSELPQAAPSLHERTSGWVVTPVARLAVWHGPGYRDARSDTCGCWLCDDDHRMARGVPSPSSAADVG